MNRTWMNLTKEELELIEHMCLGKGMTSGMTSAEMDVLAERMTAMEQKVKNRLAEMADPAIQSRYQAYRDAVETDDELECDDDALVSKGDDPGAFVMIWTWVTNKQAGIEDEDDEE